MTFADSFPSWSRAVDQEPPRAGRLRLIHAIMSEAEDGIAAAGQYLLDDHDEPLDQVIAVPCSVSVSRTLYENIEGEDELVCSSNDGIKGVGEPGGNCNRCPMNEWDSRIPPPCDVAKVYLLWLPELGRYARWSLRRSALRSAGRLLHNLSMSKGFKNLAVRISHDEMSSKRGSWLIPKIELVKLLPDMLPPDEIQ